MLTLVDTATVMEGDTLRLSVSATDPDGTIPDIEVPDLPANATFTAAEGAGELVIVPDSLQVGTLEIMIVATDGDLTDTAIVNITVLERPNWAPVLTVIGETEVLQGDTLELLLETTDQDGDSLILSAENIPENAEFTDNGDGTGSFIFTPDYIQIGLYATTFIASDGVFDDTVVVNIKVLDAPNQAPVIEHVGQQYIFVGDTLIVDIAITDVDGTALALDVIELPLNSIWIYNGADLGTFNFAPDTFQVGEHTVGLTASDGELADTLSFGVTVLLDTMALFQDGPIPCAVGNYWIYDSWSESNWGQRYEGADTFEIVDVEYDDGRLWWQFSTSFPTIGIEFCMSGDTLTTESRRVMVIRDGEHGVYSLSGWGGAEDRWNVHTTEICEIFYQTPVCSCPELSYHKYRHYPSDYEGNDWYSESIYFAVACGIVGRASSSGGPMSYGGSFHILVDYHIREE